MIPHTFNILLCLILNSFLWGFVRFYIFLEERNITSKNDNIQPMISNSIYSIAFIVVILYSINNDILKERHGFVLLIIGTVASQVIFFYMYAKMNSKSRLSYVNDLLMQINEDERYLEGNNQQVERMARINHDIKNHLTYIAYNLESKNYDKAKEYIVELINNADLNFNFIKLSDNSLNFIINHKLSQAYKKNIKIFAQIEDLKKLYLEEFDLCILLCNILDNAIEAVEGQEEKQIHIEIFNHAGYQTYFIKNTIETSILGVNSNLVTTKYNKEDHGYGFLQINDIINKYHGHIDIYELERFFCIKILIPAS
jgi:sensor histidine kinase YesM